MSARAAHKPISTSDGVLFQLSRECLRLLQLAAETENLSQAQKVAVTDSLGRYKLWAGNIGALHTGSSSLDNRVGTSQCSSEMRKHLENIKESSEFLLEQPDSSSEDTDAEPGDGIPRGVPDNARDESFETNQDLIQAISTSITYLLKTSVIVRHNPSRDPWKRILKRPLMEPRPDIEYVSNKWPKVTSKNWLPSRLGTANSRRRQYFLYRERHVHKKLWAPVKDEEGTSKHSAISSTLPSTLPDRIQQMRLDDDARSETAESQATSFVSNFPGSGSSGLAIPKRPPGHDSHPVECCLCYNIVSVPTRRSWTKHVYRDLRPYVCTLDQCDLKIFEKRSDWFSHEMEEHRTIYSCLICSVSIHGREGVKEHMETAHSDYPEKQLSLLSQSCKIETRFPVKASECPFCDDLETTLRRQYADLPDEEVRFIDGSPIVPENLFRNHVARHLEELSLFSVPPELKQEEAESEESKSPFGSSASLDSTSRREREPTDKQRGIGYMLIIENIPRNTTVQAIRSMFSKFGTVDDAIVMGDPHDRDSDVGKVTFMSESDAIAAMASMHGSKFSDRRIVVRKSLLQTSSVEHEKNMNELDERTKTGRISTAKKGKPIHKCDICGKIYTRNEHLKRHRLSHRIKSISCDVLGCRKKFQRIDLLQRHKEQEHDMDPTDSVLEHFMSDIEPQQSTMTYPGEIENEPEENPEKQQKLQRAELAEIRKTAADTAARKAREKQDIIENEEAENEPMQPEWDADVAEFFQGQVPERAEMAAKLQEEREKIESEASLEKVIQETIAQEEHEEALQKHKEAEEEAEKAADEAKLPIRFKDAVGRKFRFPWKYCKTWMGMDDLIQQAFMHDEVIGDHVAAGHYDLIGPDGEIILPQVWDSVIQPGWDITMHMWPMAAELE